MGCDIHLTVEIKDPVTGEWGHTAPAIFNNGWTGHEEISDTPFDQRHYGMFAFFADVRNYSAIPQNFGEVRGIPDDSPFSRKSEPTPGAFGFGYGAWDENDYIYGDTHSHSYLTLRELAEFDYDKPVEDRRVTVQVAPNCWSGGETAEPGGGEMMTYREFLGERYMEHLEQLKTLGGLDEVRIVFWFDN